MKTILLAVLLVAVSVVPAHAQSAFDRAFDSGVRMAIEAERLRMERGIAQQQIELMRQQVETMKETRKEFTNELFQKGFQEGHAAGYKKGMEDLVDYVKKTEEKTDQIFLNILYRMGKEIFNETSIERLTEARKGFHEALSSPNHYGARVYITLIDARLAELRQGQK
jgi:hypothetical protein